MTTTLYLPYPVGTGNNSVRHGSRGHYLTAEAKACRDAVADILRGRRAPNGRVRTEWVINPPDLRARDFDNLSKVVNDALTHAGFWVDDSNKVIESGEWQWLEPVKGGLIELHVRTV